MRTFAGLFIVVFVFSFAGRARAQETPDAAVQAGSKSAEVIQAKAGPKEAKLAEVRPVEAAQAEVEQKEVVYGRKDGMALTMQVLTPQKPNGKGIVYVISHGWRSNYSDVSYSINDSKPFWERGYTVFLVVHGSVPKYTIADALPDITRAVRFIRYHASDYRIDPTLIGITGSSAGGHLSLMIATSDDKIDPTDTDRVNKVSARVQAAAVFFPPTDFLNYGRPGANVYSDKETLYRNNRTAIFDFREWNDTEKKYTAVTDSGQLMKMLKDLSPIYRISPDDPPVLIVHGDSDQTVPLQQSISFIDRLKKAGVPGELIIKKGADHGWDHDEKERANLADWFDKYLR